MSIAPRSLSQLGWRSFYSQQLTLEDFDTCWPARVVSVHRGAITVMGERGECSVTLAGSIVADYSISPVTVGDWVLVESAGPRVARVLERASVIARLSAGTQQRSQAVVANLDTLFVVTSCNDDFNPSRLERYLAIAFEARVEVAIVLTKRDCCADPAVYVDAVRQIVPQVSAIPINVLTDDVTMLLAPWLACGQSVAFVGSSGVGKSTLVNSLCGTHVMATGDIREDDAKGRHTTSSRQLVAMPGGAWLMDTPGMRELKVGAVEAGVSAVFTDVEMLAQSCRYRNCAHQGDAGCALSEAVTNGQIDARRVKSYMKLQREAANAVRSIHERHERERQFGKMHKALKQRMRKEREGR